jgi:hypothetical protein
MRWDTDKIIKCFGGPAGTHAALQSRGHDVGLNAIRQWKTRKAIPADWIAKLILLAPDNENPLDWIVEGEPVPEMEDIF